MENDDEKASPSQSQPSDRQRYQVPSAIADFHGSLVRNSFPEPVPSKARSLSTVDHWIAYFTEGWADVGIWKSAVCLNIGFFCSIWPVADIHLKFVEMVATCLLAYTSGLIDTTIAGFNTPQAPAYVGVTNIFLLTLFIMATGPGSGGHINPLITFATVMTGMTGFSRGRLSLPASSRSAIATIF
ncbi:hypothetical protein MMC20_002672 [Loxospora ochrophaea]|nr:hypothetical protein [Loxospora ochrophaea]